MIIWFQNIISFALKMSLKKDLLHIYWVRSIYNIILWASVLHKTLLNLMKVGRRSLAIKDSDQISRRSIESFVSFCTRVKGSLKLKKGWFRNFVVTMFKKGSALFEASRVQNRQFCSTFFESTGWAVNEEKKWFFSSGQ